MEDIFVDTLEKKTILCHTEFVRQKKKASSKMKKMSNEVKNLMATKGKDTEVEAAIDSLKKLCRHIRQNLPRG